VPREPHQLFDSTEQKAVLESRNGLLQFDALKRMIAESVSGFTLTPAILLELHRLAIQDIYTCAGKFRTGPVYFQRAIVDPTLHQPPPPEQVIPLVDELCSYVNGNFGKAAIHLASYVMWRVNWVHPFFGGNGRTSRAASYLILCARLGYYLPGENTIPQQIAQNGNSHHRYERALQAADASYRNGRLDVSAMEEMMADLLGGQLYNLHQQAVKGP
jgi:fido (protein-threonine AMPylation protein)